VTRFLYDFEKLLAESDADNDINRLYTSTTDEYGDLVSQWGEGEGSLYHQYDGQWSTEALIDDSQAVAARYAHRAFGLQTMHSGPADTAQTYVGQKGYYRDDTLDLYLLGGGNGGRYYDAAQGRFISEDPKRHRSNDNNLFRYAINDPLNRIDPSGEQSCCVPCTPSSSSSGSNGCPGRPGWGIGIPGFPGFWPPGFPIPGGGTGGGSGGSGGGSGGVGDPGGGTGTGGGSPSDPGYTPPGEIPPPPVVPDPGVAPTDPGATDPSGSVPPAEEPTCNSPGCMGEPPCDSPGCSPPPPEPVPVPIPEPKPFDPCKDCDWWSPLTIECAICGVCTAAKKILGVNFCPTVAKFVENIPDLLKKGFHLGPQTRWGIH
jgi:RHS repeat-associated protein